LQIGLQYITWFFSYNMVLTSISAILIPELVTESVLPSCCLNCQVPLGSIGYSACAAYNAQMEEIFD